MSRAPQTMFEKVWDQHQVTAESADTPAVLYIDLYLIHEVTSPQAFSVLRERGLPVLRHDLTLATMDRPAPSRCSEARPSRSTRPQNRFASSRKTAPRSAWSCSVCAARSGAVFISS